MNWKIGGFWTFNAFDAPVLTWSGFFLLFAGASGHNTA